MTVGRNILFITADQWRADCLSSLSHPVVETPHLDYLAREGVLFTRHFSNTSPCSPSRASLHTGLYQHNHRVTMNGTPLDRRHTNWALEVRTAGYDPALIGYTDQTIDPRDAAADDPRLKTYEGVLPGLKAIADTGMEHLGPWGQFLRARGYELPPDDRFILWMRENGSDYEEDAPFPRPWIVRAEHNDTTWHVDQAINYISEQQSNPWVLHLSLLRPHPPWIASYPWNKRYDPAALPKPVRRPSPDQEAAQHPWLAHHLSQPLVQAPDDDRKLQRMRTVYFALITEVDENLGRLFAHLKLENQWNNTLIIFTSDHGEQLGDHWLLGKEGYFDPSYAVPLIIRDPRREADTSRGQRVSQFTEHVDIMPTILEFSGTQIPPQCDGCSLMPFLHAGELLNWRSEAHWEFDFRNASFDAAEINLNLSLHQCNLAVIRDQNYKYVHFAALPPLLFDLKNDPGEFINLARSKDHAHISLEYVQKMLSWRQTFEDQTLTHKMATANGMVERQSPRTRK